MITDIIVSTVTALGGFEFVKFLIMHKYNRRKAEAEADSVEFHTLKETVDFLQAQLKLKEERFAEQTTLLRKLNAEVLEVTNQKAAVELDLQRYRCLLKSCPNRQPQNGY